MTREELERRKDQAVRFARDVRGDDDLGDEIEDERLDEYAEKRRIKILNPKGNPMPTPTRRELLEQVEQLQRENDLLQDKLESISDVLSEDSDESEDDDRGE